MLFESCQILLGMKKVIIAVLLLVIFAVAGYFLWQNRHEIFFRGDDIELQENGEKEKGFFDFFSSSDEDTGEDDDVDDDEAAVEVEAEDELDALDEEDMANITAADCENDCEDWKEDDEDFEICLEICGFNTGEEKENVGNCEEMEDTEADICFRRKAITEKNDSYCEKIVDDDLRANCRNRVVEELIP